jgi:hypothetical protein
VFAVLDVVSRHLFFLFYPLLSFLGHSVIRLDQTSSSTLWHHWVTIGTQLELQQIETMPEHMQKVAVPAEACLNVDIDPL